MTKATTTELHGSVAETDEMLAAGNAAEHEGWTKVAGQVTVGGTRSMDAKPTFATCASEQPSESVTVCVYLPAGTP